MINPIKPPILPTKQDIAPIDNLEGIIELFKTAKKHLKYPKIRLRKNELPIQLSATEDNSKYPSSVTFQMKSCCEGVVAISSAG